MVRRHLAAATMVAGLVGMLPSALNAATFAFSGTQSYINVLNPPGTGRCAPNTTVNIMPGNLSSSGTSNLGGFSSTQSHCLLGLAPPTSIFDGIFSFAFDAGDTLTGIYTGNITNAARPDIFDFDLVEEFIVTGGTGRFLSATGAFTLTGSLVRYENPRGPGYVADFNGGFRGNIEAPAVPEPATWAMLVLGFGMVGYATRQRVTVVRLARHRGVIGGRPA